MSVGANFAGPLLFFTRDEARSVEAVAARLVPGTEADPGAREAGVVTFIDRTLAGYGAHLQTFYRVGLEQVDGICMSEHGQRFQALDARRQDDMLRLIEAGGDGNPARWLAQFLDVIYEHTLEGMFGDPAYGGNRNAVGWRMIGFPGAQWGYSGEQMVEEYDARLIEPVTLKQVQGFGQGGTGE